MNICISHNLSIKYIFVTFQNILHNFFFLLRTCSLKIFYAHFLTHTSNNRISSTQISLWMQTKIQYNLCVNIGILTVPIIKPSRNKLDSVETEVIYSNSCSHLKQFVQYMAVYNSTVYGKSVPLAQIDSNTQYF